MSSLFDEIFGSEGVRDNPIDTLVAHIMDSGVTVVEVKIKAGVTGIETEVRSRKEFIAEIGARENMETFVEEIRPILEKIGPKITEKYRAFISKDPNKAAHKMAEWLVEERSQARR